MGNPPFGQKQRHASDTSHHAQPDGPLHGVPAGMKVAFALTLVVATAIVPPAWLWWHGAVAVFLLVIVVAGRIPILPLLRRLAWLAPFVAGAALAATLHGTTGPGWRVVALRGGLCLLTMLVLAAMTSFSAQISVLRRVRVPGLLITTLVLMHRYLFVLGDEAERMRRARSSRTLVPRRALDWTMPATIVGRLFLRASERAERIYLAMCARGWR